MIYCSFRSCCHLPPISMVCKQMKNYSYHFKCFFLYRVRNFSLYKKAERINKSKKWSHYHWSIYHLHICIVVVPYVEKSLFIKSHFTFFIRHDSVIDRNLKKQTKCNGYHPKKEFMQWWMISYTYCVKARKKLTNLFLST